MRFKTATLNQSSGPYAKGQRVTTHPAAPLLAEAQNEEPVRVDPERFATWKRQGFFKRSRREKTDA